MFNNINPRDYNSRLNNTIVVYDGFPVGVQVVSEKEFVISPVYPESKFKSKSINPNDPLLDISTPDLGYYNIEIGGTKMAFYLERGAFRRWRQGLCSTNCTVYSLSGEIHTRKNRDDISSYMYNKGLEDLIQNRYPFVYDGLKNLTEKKVHSVALNRNIAISRKDDIFNVWYKRDKVGYITPGQRPVVKVPSEPMAYIISKNLRELPWEVE